MANMNGIDAALMEQFMRMNRGRPQGVAGMMPGGMPGGSGRPGAAASSGAVFGFGSGRPPLNPEPPNPFSPISGGISPTPAMGSGSGVGFGVGSPRTFDVVDSRDYPPTNVYSISSGPSMPSGQGTPPNRQPQMALPAQPRPPLPENGIDMQAIQEMIRRMQGSRQ